MFYYVKKRNRIKNKKYTFKYEYDEAENEYIEKIV